MDSQRLRSVPAGSRQSPSYIEWVTVSTNLGHFQEYLDPQVQFYISWSVCHWANNQSYFRASVLYLLMYLSLFHQSLCLKGNEMKYDGTVLS